MKNMAAVWLGTLGGQSRSTAKRAAARKNAAKARRVLATIRQAKRKAAR